MKAIKLDVIASATRAEIQLHIYAVQQTMYDTYAVSKYLCCNLCAHRQLTSETASRSDRRNESCNDEW